MVFSIFVFVLEGPGCIKVKKVKKKDSFKLFGTAVKDIFEGKAVNLEIILKKVVKILNLRTGCLKIDVNNLEILFLGIIRKIRVNYKKVRNIDS